MQVTIVLKHNFGHPDNRPTKEAVVQTIVNELPEALASIKKKDAVNIQFWGVVKVEAH